MKTQLEVLQSLHDELSDKLARHEIEIKFYTRKLLGSPDSAIFGNNVNDHKNIVTDIKERLSILNDMILDIKKKINEERMSSTS